MDALNAVRSGADLCDNVLSTSAGYQTLSDGIDCTGATKNEDNEELTTVTEFKTISNGCKDSQHTSISDYCTLPPDIGNNGVADEDYQCKICIKRFKTLQACLRHDLVDHNKDRKTPQKAVRLALKTMLPVLEQGDHQADRPRIHQILQNCQRGLELHELLNVYCISDEKARHIWTLVGAAVRNDLSSIRNISIYKFGSIMNGLMTWDSDVDIYITAGNQNERVRPNWQSINKERPLFNRVNALLRRSGKFEDIVTIRNARVPIIKCRHPATGMKVDINCSCPSSVVNSQFLNNLLQFDVRLRSLMRFLKIWAKQMKLIGRGNMTSYCLTTLVLFYLQQPFGGRQSVVPSIKNLQMNIQPKYVDGINYAYDIRRHMLPLPIDLTTQVLLRGFLHFYRNFDFSGNMVTPFLGKSISLSEFRSGEFRYFDYERQLQTMREFAGDRYDVDDLNIDRCMVIQDPFQLNQNIARGVSISHFEYFRKCIEYAYHICMNHEIKNSAELYERLLFDILTQIEVDAQALRKSAGQRMPIELIFSFAPSRVELRALVNYQLQLNNANAAEGVNNNINREWVQHYIEAIYAILTFIYCMKVRLVSSNNHVNDEPEDETTQKELVQLFWQLLQKNGELVWHIKSSIDLWNGRMFSRQNACSFMEYQIKQTEQLLSERANAEAYAIEVNGLLMVKLGDGYKSLTIMLTQDKSARIYLTKKDPLRKFFTSFKNSMQNFNLKEKLQAESGRKQIPQSQELKIWKKRTTDIVVPTN